MALARSSGHGRAAAPVKLVHLGLGNFFRAHQAWYTEHAADASDWGYAAFTGRTAGLAAALAAQDGLYTLVTRAADGDRGELVSSLSAVHPRADHEAWLGYLRSPAVAAVTITVTEAGYCRRPDGGLDTTRPEVAADIARLRAKPARSARAPQPAETAPGRLLAGLSARREADAGPIAIVPCDNLPANGPLTRRVLTDLAELVDADLAAWIETSVTVATTMVDRITPRPTADDARVARELTGLDDRCPVITEPFSDWVLSGDFPAGRPRWQDSGATFTADILPFEERKIWLLNGAHSLLAYAGSITGHATVASAVADPAVLAWLTQWWDEASPHLRQPADEVARYRTALLERFGNGRMRDRLDRIAADGSQKLPVRILPVLRAERQAGRLPAAATLVLAAWICHLRGAGAPVSDARASELRPLAAGPIAVAAHRLLAWLDPPLADDVPLVAQITEQCESLTADRAAQPPPASS